MQDAVLTNAGIDCFNTPASLEVLDLNGCWLLTKDAILSFHQCHPEIEIRHELVSISLSDSEDARYHSPAQTSMRTTQQRRFSSSPLKSEMTNIIGALIACSGPILK